MDFGGLHRKSSHWRWLANANFAPANEREWTNFGSGARILSTRISANLINIGANPRWGERVSDEHNRTAGQSILIEAPDAVNPHTAAESAALRDCVAEVLAELTPREERILRMRFGIRMPDHTLEQVSKTFGVTRERIRQIEGKALQKLSHSARARKLLTFTES